jgi:hypothetical protein
MLALGQDQERALAYEGAGVLRDGAIRRGGPFAYYTGSYSLKESGLSCADHQPASCTATTCQMSAGSATISKCATRLAGADVDGRQIWRFYQLKVRTRC